jgi:phosphohistidine swiveling domain-containing protein
MSAVEWEAPGPGGWMMDDNHYSGAVSGFIASVLPGEVGPAMASGFRRYGLLMEGMRIALVNGRLYSQPKIVGAPAPKEGRIPSPPPKAVMRLMFLLHPELRRRRRTARKALATKLWRADRQRWRTQDAPRFRARNRALGQVVPSKLDDAALLHHFEECLQQFRDGNAVHFINIPASSFPVGDWAGLACKWTGCTPAEAIAILQGSNREAAATLELLEPLADAVARSPEAVTIVRGKGDAGERLARLRGVSAEIVAALDGYLDEHGHRVVTGYDVTDRTLLEMPHIALASIASQLDSRRRPDVTEISRAAATRLRERVPQHARAQYDVLLEEARAAYGLRDEDVSIAWMWPLGLLRRVLLEIGNRLEIRGGLEDRRHIFDCTPDEIRALFGGEASAPTALEGARRAEERRALEKLAAPQTLGPPDPPPPPGLLPRECERMMNAIMLYMLNMNSQPPAAKAGGLLSGTPASRGRYEGRARIVLGPADFDKLAQGDVLVAGSTSPTYNVVLPLLGAVVTDRGGVLCHAAIVAREFGIPAVVGTREATTRIPDGGHVIVDGESGTVEIRS